MIKRLVKMTFKPEHIQEFIELFNSKKDLIAGFEGCKHLELLQDTDNETVFFTYSIWESSNDLENYRQSPLFKAVWKKTKVLFGEKPDAWSTVIR